MKLMTLVWAGLWRKPARTAFTVISLAVGFLLFGLLQGVNSAFATALARTKADRLLIDSRFDAPMPLAYADRIARLHGVTQVTWTEFLPTYYQDPKRTALVLVTAPDRFFRVRNEFRTSPEALQRLIHTRTGFIALDTLAREFGWKVGDQVSLIAGVPRKDGGHAWTFDVVGIMSAPANPGQYPFAVANYDYFDEARADDRGTVTRFIIRVADARRTAATATSIDRLFASSAVPTLTQAESEFAARDLASIGDVGRLTTAVIIAVFFAMLFLTGNVVLQSVRERTAEFAVLKTLGYSDWQVLGLIVLEALAICLCGAAVGLGLAAVGYHLLSGSIREVSLWLNRPDLSLGVILAGVGFAVGLTALSAALPAWSAKRLNIVEALRAHA